MENSQDTDKKCLKEPEGKYQNNPILNYHFSASKCPRFNNHEINAKTIQSHIAAQLSCQKTEATGESPMVHQMSPKLADFRLRIDGQQNV